MHASRDAVSFGGCESFDRCNEVRIGFKTTEQENPNEHWMNRMSVWATRSSRDRWPGGSISHAEIMLQVREGEWRRWSIAKKTRTRDEDGRLVWCPGRVHNKPVDALNDDYVYVTLSVDRSRQRHVYEFLEGQVGGGFNKLGYYLNFVCPCSYVGTRGYSRWAALEERSWFCTELITTALQAARLEPFVDMTPCKTSPNALYRACVGMPSSMPCANPGRELKISIQ